MIAGGASAAVTEGLGETAARTPGVRVALAGERGKTGSAVAAVLAAAEDVDYVGGFGRDTDAGDFVREHGAQVLVDFTHASAALENALGAAAAGAAPVIGTTGLAAGDVDRIETACRAAGVGGMVAANFSIGAIVMMWLAEKAAPYFDGVEIIESHHATKVDKPSGTALATGRRLGGDPPIHSVRLPGFVAEQQVILGLAGQILEISHRTTSREAYGPGVLLAVKRIVAEPRFYRGLDELLNLK